MTGGAAIGNARKIKATTASVEKAPGDGDPLLLATTSFVRNCWPSEHEEGRDSYRRRRRKHRDTER